MRGARAIGIALGLVSLFMAASAHADSLSGTLAVAPQESIVIPVSVPVTSGTSYRVKVCFSDVLAKPTTKSASGLACEGETWNGTEWLTQTDDWDDHPLLAVSGSHVFGSITVRSESRLPAYLYIILLDSSKSSSSRFRSPDSYTLSERVGDHTVALTGFKPTGERVTSGYFSVTDRGYTLFIPAGPEVTLYSNASSAVAVSLFDSADTQIGNGTFELVGIGLHEVAVNPQPTRLVQPKLTLVGQAYVGQSIAFHVQSSGPTGVIQWYEDGILIHTGLEQELARSYAKTGSHRIEVFLQDSKESAQMDVVIHSYQNITLKQLLPNPAGRDTAEQITFQNGNDFPVEIRGWQLRSRQSSTVIPVALSIPANSDAVLPTANRLLNRGGTYDLYSESNVLVDTVTYPAVEEADVVTRDGIFWTAPVHAAETKQDDTVVELTGAVIKPSGKTFDIATPEGDVHVVIHPDFDGVKPRLEKSMTIKVTGIWRTSKNGRYLSVRSGHSVAVLSEAPVKPKAVTAPKAKVPKEASAAKKTTSVKSLKKTLAQANAPPGAADVLSVSYTNQSPVWLFTLLVCIGFVLALPSWRHHAV